MSYYKNKSEKEKEEGDDRLGPIGKAVGAVAGAAFAAWGISKLFSSSSESSSSSNKKMMEPLKEDEYIYNEALEPSFLYISEGKRQPKDEKWSLPQKGWMKLNTDGSLVPPESIGGVFRNENGVWVVGFARKIQGCAPHNETAELWAIRIGLSIAWDRGFKKIEVETDCDSAERLFKGDQEPSNDLQKHLVQDCTDLLKRNWSVRLKHIYREANEVAHEMADIGHGLGFGSTYFDSPPTEKVKSSYKHDLLELRR